MIKVTTINADMRYDGPELAKETFINIDCITYFWEDAGSPGHYRPHTRVFVDGGSSYELNVKESATEVARRITIARKMRHDKLL